jgi:hypothetical protein
MKAVCGLRFGVRGRSGSGSGAASCYLLNTKFSNRMFRLRFDVFKEVKIQVFPKDGGSMDLRNFGILPHHYTDHNPENRDLNALPF